MTWRAPVTLQSLSKLHTSHSSCSSHACMTNPFNQITGAKCTGQTSATDEAVTSTDGQAGHDANTSIFVPLCNAFWDFIWPPQMPGPRMADCHLWASDFLIEGRKAEFGTSESLFRQQWNPALKDPCDVMSIKLTSTDTTLNLSAFRSHVLQKQNVATVN